MALQKLTPPPYQAQVQDSTGFFTKPWSEWFRQLFAFNGSIGEYISSVISTPTNAPTTAQFGDATHIVLTAGDWDISLVVFFSANGSTTNEVRAGISTTPGNSSTGLLTGDNYVAQIGPTVNFNSSMCISGYRASLSAGATYYLKVLASYSAGAPQYTCRISARRVR